CSLITAGRYRLRHPRQAREMSCPATYTAGAAMASATALGKPHPAATRSRPRHQILPTTRPIIAKNATHPQVTAPYARCTSTGAGRNAATPTPDAADATMAAAPTAIRSRGTAHTSMATTTPAAPSATTMDCPNDWAAPIQATGNVANTHTVTVYP